jgi:hypothetical protein
LWDGNGIYHIKAESDLKVFQKALKKLEEEE